SSAPSTRRRALLFVVSTVIIPSPVDTLEMRVDPRWSQPGDVERGSREAGKRSGGAAGQRVGPVDQAYCPGTVGHPDRRGRAPLPAVERVADGGVVRGLDLGARRDLVTLDGGELHHVVLHGQDRVASGDLPPPVGPPPREAITDFDCAQYAAHRSQEHRGVVFYQKVVRPSADLGP